MKRKVQKLFKFLYAPYTVGIVGGVCHGTYHLAWSYAEALEWAKCYNQVTARGVYIETRSGRLVGFVRAQS